MRTNHVAKARKDQGTCSKCGQPIPKGATYKWLKGRYGPRRSYHASCVIPRSHTTGSAKLGQLWDAQDTL